MDRQYIDDHHVVARYLADRLDDREREAFETYFLEHPEVVQEMEAAARFKAGLMQLRDSGELEALLTPKPHSRQRRYLAIAALIAGLAVGIGYFLVQNAANPPMLAASLASLESPEGAFASASPYVILRTRGSSYDAEVELPEPGRAIELRVRPEFESQPALYRITFSRIAADDSIKLLAQVGGLKPADDGLVPVYLDATRIEPGLYQLLITSEAGEQSIFVIKMRRP